MSGDNVGRLYAEAARQHAAQYSQDAMAAHPVTDAPVLEAG